MGTRNLTVVKIDGEYKVAQYGQWDGYPQGQGLTALQFLRDEMIEDKFVRAVSNVTEISKEKLDSYWKECGADDSGMVSLDGSFKFKELHPELHRDTGADILEIIQAHPDGIELSLDLEFASQSLFCEWAWVVDFDTRTFEGYKGFNDKRTLTEDDRFYFLRDLERDGYSGVVLAASFSLDKLPSDEEFLEAFYSGEEEEDDT